MNLVKQLIPTRRKPNTLKVHLPYGVGWDYRAPDARVSMRMFRRWIRNADGSYREPVRTTGTYDAHGRSI